MGLLALLCGLAIAQHAQATTVSTPIGVVESGTLPSFLPSIGCGDGTTRYAPFTPGYLGRALEVTNAIIEQIEKLVPGAFAAAFVREGMKR